MGYAKYNEDDREIFEERIAAKNFLREWEKQSNIKKEGTGKDSPVPLLFCGMK